MANDPTVIPHPDKIDDVLEVPQPGTSDAAKSDPKKKDTTYKENTTSPDELISLDELYTTTGQETLEVVVDGYRELKDHQRLSRAHGDAAKLNTEKWIEFSDKSNAIRYGDSFVKQLSQSSTQTFTDGERFTRVLLKRSQERGQTVRKMMRRIDEKIIPVAKSLRDQYGSTSVPATSAKLTVFIRQDESVREGLSRLCNIALGYPACSTKLTAWAEKVDAALVSVRQAASREELAHALNRVSDLGGVPEGVTSLCRVFCGEYPTDVTTPRQLYVATEKNMRFKDVVLEDNLDQLAKVADEIMVNWFVDGNVTPIEQTSQRLSHLAQSLMDSFVTPSATTHDDELLFAFMDTQRTCSRLSMLLDMVQGLLQSVSVVLFTALRARTEMLKVGQGETHAN